MVFFSNNFPMHFPHFTFYFIIFFSAPFLTRFSYFFISLFFALLIFQFLFYFYFLFNFFKFFYNPIFSFFIALCEKIEIIFHMFLSFLLCEFSWEFIWVFFYWKKIMKISIKRFLSIIPLILHLYCFQAEFTKKC